MVLGELEGEDCLPAELKCSACQHVLQNGIFVDGSGVTPHELREFADHLESHDGN